jgi:2-phosphosulfolactate phosphatase
LNKKFLIQYLREAQEDILLLCAGWQGKVNLEDTYFAGAVLTDLMYDFQFSNDSCALARSAYHLGKNNPLRFLSDSSHFQRLKRLGNEKDMEFCLRTDLYEVLPILHQNELIRLV